MLPNAYGGHWNKRWSSQNVSCVTNRMIDIRSEFSWLRIFCRIGSLSTTLKLSSAPCLHLFLFRFASFFLRYLTLGCWHSRTRSLFSPLLFQNSSVFPYMFLLSLQQDVSASRPYVTADVASPLYNSNFEIPTYVEWQRTFLQFLCWFVETSPFCVCLPCRL